MCRPHPPFTGVRGEASRGLGAGLAPCVCCVPPFQPSVGVGGLVAMAAQSFLFGVCWRGVEGRMRLSMANARFFVSKVRWYLCVVPGGANECSSWLLGG
jgi:hypothetical protein